MIPQADIIAWRQVAPWADDGMVEQDLVLSRALVEIFADVALAQANDLRITRAEFERNLAAKARHRLFLEEVTPMLAPGIVYDARAALDLVQREFIERLPGAPWKGA